MTLFPSIFKIKASFFLWGHFLSWQLFWCFLARSFSLSNLFPPLLLFWCAELWGRIGDASGRIRDTLEKHWGRIGTHRGRIRDTLEKHWGRIGDALGTHWGHIRDALGTYQRSVLKILDLYSIPKSAIYF